MNRLSVKGFYVCMYTLEMYCKMQYFPISSCYSCLAYLCMIWVCATKMITNQICCQLLDKWCHLIIMNIRHAQWTTQTHVTHTCWWRGTDISWTYKNRGLDALFGTVDSIGRSQISNTALSINSYFFLYIVNLSFWFRIN